MESHLMTIKEVAAYLQVTTVCIHQWARKGIINKVKVGGKVFFIREEVIKLAV